MHLVLQVAATAFDVILVGRGCLADFPDGESGLGSWGRVFAWVVFGGFVAWAIWS